MILQCRYQLMTALFLLTLIGCQQSQAPSVSDCSHPQAVLEDTPENRAKLTEEYFKLVPFQKVMLDTGDEIAKRLPQDQQAFFKQFWKSAMTEENLASINSVAKQSMSQNMTTSELSAFVRFMSDPAGQGAMEKMKFYMADVMPLMQQVSQKSMAQFQQQSGGVK